MTLFLNKNAFLHADYFYNVTNSILSSFKNDMEHVGVLFGQN